MPVNTGESNCLSRITDAVSFSYNTSATSDSIVSKVNAHKVSLPCMCVCICMCVFVWVYVCMDVYVLRYQMLRLARYCVVLYSPGEAI